MKITSKIIATTTAMACVAAFSTVGVSAAFAQDANDDAAVIAPAPGEEAVPFTAEVGGVTLSVTETLNGYAHINWGDTGADPVNLYTVTIPQGTEKVSLSFGDKAVTTYNYAGADDNADPSPYLGPWYEDYTTSFTSTDADVDLNKDGVLDTIRVQNPYNADYTGGELLYAIQFKYAADQPGKPGYKPITKAGVTYSFDGKSLTAIGASKSKKTVTIPATLKYGSKSYKVTGITSKAFKGTKVASVKVKTNAITKKTTKNCLKSSKVSKVTVYASSAKVANKTAKCFTKANAGKKVKVVAKVTSK